MDRRKINRIVEFVRCMDFSYDTDDVIEGLSGILSNYGIYNVLDREEYFMLMDELLKLAERAEIAEAVRWASMNLKCGQISYPIVVDSDSAESLMSDYRVPGYI